MGNNEINAEEKEYLDGYDRTAYPCPSLTADIAVFAVMSEETPEYRLDPLNMINLLLIERGNHPYKGDWALPGGFCMENESIEEAAGRELYEETGIDDTYLKSIGMFSKEGRDPRGWIVSEAFMALIDPSGYRIHSGSDAWNAAWFSLSVGETVLSLDNKDDEITERKQYDIGLRDRNTGKLINAVVLSERLRRARNEKTEYKTVKSSGLAFDHAVIILKAYLELRKEVERDIGTIFYLMPPRFTLTGLQKIYEIVVDHPVLGPNFRRKITPYVRETDETVQGVGHRPARLYEAVLM